MGKSILKLTKINQMKQRILILVEDYKTIKHHFKISKILKKTSFQ